jgi:hypothetical protein
MRGASGGFPLSVGSIFVLHLVTMVLMAILEVCYIVFLFKTERVPRLWKPLWMVTLLLGHVAVMPFFFSKYIWPDEPCAVTQGKS